MDVATVRDLGTSAQVWAVRSASDWIKWIPNVRVFGFGHGSDPADPAFGARVLTVDDAQGHDGYLVGGTSSLRLLTEAAIGAWNCRARIREGRIRDLATIPRYTCCHIDVLAADSTWSTSSHLRAPDPPAPRGPPASRAGVAPNPAGSPQKRHDEQVCIAVGRLLVDLASRTNVRPVPVDTACCRQTVPGSIARGDAPLVSTGPADCATARSWPPRRSRRSRHPATRWPAARG